MEQQQPPTNPKKAIQRADEVRFMGDVGVILLRIGFKQLFRGHVATDLESLLLPEFLSFFLQGF
jgi:hypothetical protein